MSSSNFLKNFGLWILKLKNSILKFKFTIKGGQKKCDVLAYNYS